MAESKEMKMKKTDLMIITDENEILELEFKGEDIAYLYALREYIEEEKEIQLCAVKKDHPIVGHPRMLIRGKNPKDALKKALNSLLKDTNALLHKVK